MQKNLLNNSAYNFIQQNNVAKKLDIILPIAKYISYGFIFAIFTCVISGKPCDISNLIEIMVDTRLHGKSAVGAIIIYPLAILGCGLNYLVPFVMAYIYHAIDVSIDVVKSDYQVSAKTTSFLIWGYCILGILCIICDIFEEELELLPLLFGILGIVVLVVNIVWVRQLSQKWSTLSLAHKATADLLRIYTYLKLGVLIVSIIGYAISPVVGDAISIIDTGIDLYLFYKLGSCYHAIVYVCSTAKDSE